jgi:hypothetical protein
MIYALLLCTFMSSSGEVCDDIKFYQTIDECVAEANRRIPTEAHNENYKCEGRRR